MRNRINKSNKTKFDYIARKLGILGVFIFAITLAIGGPILASVLEENRVLTNALTQTVGEDTKNYEKSQNQDYVYDEGVVEHE